MQPNSLIGVSNPDNDKLRDVARSSLSLKSRARKSVRVKKQRKTRSMRRSFRSRIDALGSCTCTDDPAVDACDRCDDPLFEAPPARTAGLPQWLGSRDIAHLRWLYDALGASARWCEAHGRRLSRPEWERMLDLLGDTTAGRHARSHLEWRIRLRPGERAERFLTSSALTKLATRHGLEFTGDIELLLDLIARTAWTEGTSDAVDEWTHSLTRSLVVADGRIMLTGLMGTLRTMALPLGPGWRFVATESHSISICAQHDVTITPGTTSRLASDCPCFHEIRRDFLGPDDAESWAADVVRLLDLVAGAHSRASPLVFRRVADLLIAAATVEQPNRRKIPNRHTKETP